MLNLSYFKSKKFIIGSIIATILIVAIILILVFTLSPKVHKIMIMNKDHPFDEYNYYKMGTYLLSDLPPDVQKEVEPQSKSVKNVKLPVRFDSRKKWKDLISKPLNQGTCGSCWAFSTSTSASDRLRIASKGKVLTTPIIYQLHYKNKITDVKTIDTLSPYHLAACNNCDFMYEMGNVKFSEWMQKNHECDHKCNGGIIAYAYNFISKFGITSMICEYKQKGHREQYVCDPKVNCPMYKSKNQDPNIDVHKLVGIDTIKHAIMTQGPVAAGFSVPRSFMEYSRDIKNATKPYPINRIDNDPIIGGHAVVIVGWDIDEKGKEYWIIRNSWGDQYNGPIMQGYFYMYIGETNLELGCYEINM